MPNNANVSLYGTVTQEPKLDKTANGQTWLKVNLAVQTTKKDQNPKNPKYPYESDFYSVNIYGAAADRLLGKIKVGAKLDVLGDMNLSKPYQTRDGSWHVTPNVNSYKTEIRSSAYNNTTNNTQNNNYNNAPSPETEEEAPF